VSFTFDAPRKVFGQYVVTQDRIYYWQHEPVKFSGKVTLVRYPEAFQGVPKNYVLYTFAHDRSGTAGSDMGLAEDFGNASAFSIVFNAQNLTAQFQFERKCTSTTLTQMESCNDYLYDPGGVVHGITAGYGTMTSDTTPYNPSERLNGFIKEYVIWTANLWFSGPQDYYLWENRKDPLTKKLNQTCFCYANGESNASQTEESYIDYSVLSLPCDQRPSVINQQTRALDALLSRTETAAATLELTNAR